MAALRPAASVLLRAICPGGDKRVESPRCCRRKGHHVRQCWLFDFARRSVKQQHPGSDGGDIVGMVSAWGFEKEIG